MAEETNLKPLEILVIDDNPLLRELLEDMLKPYMVNVTTAAGGLEGIEKYKARIDLPKSESDMKPYDAVLTDLNMPRASGADVTREIKKVNPQTQVIIITGAESNDEYGRLSEELKELSPDGILQKPLKLSQIEYLTKQIRSVIELRKINVNYQPEPPFYQLPTQP